MHLGIGICGYTGNQEKTVLTRWVPTEETFRFASLPMITASSDTPASTFIEGRLSPIEVRKGMAVDGNGRFAGVMQQTASDVALVSTDGELDELYYNHVFRDRPIYIKAARTTRDGSREVAPALASFTSMFNGIIIDSRIDRDHLIFRVEDGMKRLDKEIQEQIYEGLGGKDGGADLRGQKPPLCYGRASNISPTLIDALNGVYQVHDGEVKAINDVYDRAVPLEFVKDVNTYAELMALVREGEEGDDGLFDIPVGGYCTCIREGYYRLGGLPSGIVTADVEGDGINDGPVTFDGDVLFDQGVGWDQIGDRAHSRYAGGIIYRILTTRAGFKPNEIDIDRLVQFDAENPYEINLFISSKENPTTRQVCAAIVDSIGAVLCWSRQGQVKLAALDGPAPGSVIEIDQTKMSTDGVEIQPLPYGAPWPFIRVRKNINWTVLTEDQIAIDASNREFLTQPASYAELVDKRIQAVLPDRPILTIESLVREEQSAIAVAQRILNFYSLTRGLFRVVVRGYNFRLDLFETVKVFFERYGMQNGRLLLVLEIAERPSSYETELLLFG